MKRLFKIGCIGIAALIGLIVVIGIFAGGSEDSGEVRESTPAPTHATSVAVATEATRVAVVEVTATPLPPTPTPSVNPVSINPTAHGVENLPETLPHNITLYTEGPSTELPCFASVTVVDSSNQDQIERYQTFTEAGSYRIPATVGGKKVWEFNTQYCNPWSVSGDSS